MRTQILLLLTSLFLGEAVASPSAATWPGKQEAPKQSSSIDESPRNSRRQIQNQDFINQGGILVNSTSSITAIQANITVPDVSPVADDDSSVEWSSSAWVGINGHYDCPSGNGLWQAGVGWIWASNNWTYYAWWEWLPGPPTKVSVVVSPGDNVYVQLTVESPTTGTYTIINNSNGQSTTAAVTGEAFICTANAQWIIEDTSGPQADGEGLVMPNFGRIEFGDASYTAGGMTYGVDADSEELILLNDIAQYTSCITETNYLVDCTYGDGSPP